MLKLAVAQLNFTVGDFEGNLQAILSQMLKAERAGAQVVVFSELALCGYYPGDLLQDFAFLHKLERSLDKIRRASRKLPKLHIVLGTARPRKGAGKPLHNSLLVIRDGQIIAEYHKQLLMQHGVFDEHRHFEAAPETACLATIDGYKVGFLICEDGWNDQGADYKINPFNALRAEKPDLVISINASPADMGKRAQCHSLFAAAAKHSRLPLLYVNQIGAQDQWVFDGASFAVSPTQGIAFEAARFSEDFQVLGFDQGQFSREDGQALLPPSADGLSKGEFISNQIVLGLRDYVRRCGYARVVLPCTGGAHDALALVLAVQALGASSVFALHLPSAEASTDAQLAQLCGKLGVKAYTFPIDATMAALSHGFQQSFASELYGLARENLAARARGAIVMSFSNAFQTMVINSANKSLLTLGLITLYGDLHAGLGILGDLYHTECLELAHFLNRHSEIIPSSLLDVPAITLPGIAPLASDTLDAILKWQVEGKRLPRDEERQVNQTVQHLVRTEEGKKLVSHLLQLVAGNEYKRRQAAPVLRVRSRAFDSGRQMPITAKS